MGRPAKFTSDAILDTALRLLAHDGVAALNISSIARDLGAPSGSIYHRFASRDVLVATLWLRAVERFQATLTDPLSLDDPRASVRAVAAAVLEWCRNNPMEAQLLLLHRSDNLLTDGWPEEVTSRNRRQRTRVARAIDELGHRLGARSDADRRRVAFAAIDLPYAAARASLVHRQVPPRHMDSIVDDAVIAVVNGITAPKEPPR